MDEGYVHKVLIHSSVTVLQSADIQPSRGSRELRDLHGTEG